MEIQQYSVIAHLSYTPESIDAFVDLCEQAINLMTADARTRFLLKTAVDELSLNAVEHGYKKLGGLVHVQFSRLADNIRFDIYDNGCGLEVSSARTGRIAQEIADVAARGWAFSILNRLSGGLHISPNEPHGLHVSFEIPVVSSD